MGNWDWLRSQPEGQFLERKSCYRRTGAGSEADIKQAVRSLAEALAAMANAEGGTVVLGIEDDGTVTGIPERYSIEEIGKQIRDYIRPAIPLRWREIAIEQKRVWVFETDWSSEVHQLTDGRYPYRHNDQNLPFPASDIGAIKRARRQLLTEAEYVHDATLEIPS